MVSFFISRSMMLRLTILCIVTMALSLILAQGGSMVIADDGMENTAIAYVSSSTDNQSIRLINPDGTNDREIWRVPEERAPGDGIGTLSWHPNNNEILFDSGHDWQRSMAVRDLYTIAPNGSALRRVSSPPGPLGFDDYPTGTVTFVLDAVEQGDVQVYTEGAAAPISYFARIGETYQITQTVADYGEGIRQNIRLWDPDTFDYACNFSEEGWVDVIPGQIRDVGTIFFSVTSDAACPRMFSSTWSQDGSRIVYLFREATTSIDPENNIWQIDAQPPINTVGSRVLDMNDYVSEGRLYRAVFAPTAAEEDSILFLQNEAIYDQIYYATTANAPNRQFIDTGSCPLVTCDILDIAWLPDASGFMIAQYESDLTSGNGIIYRYTFADDEWTEILRLPGEAIGKLAVSPDGNSIVFERGPRLKDVVDEVFFGPEVLCPCELWRVDSGGDGLERLVADGRAPAWSTDAPTVGPPPNPNAIPRAWLPLVLR
ncbi:MAG: hypothetical protein AAGF95_25675 [Chloroflexota bacterium]